LYKDLATEYNCELNYNYRSGSDIIKFVSENTICNNIVSGLNTQGIINTDYLNDNTEHDNKIDTFVSELKTLSENKEVSEKHLILSEKNDVLINIYIKLLKSNVKDISLKGLNDLLPIFKEVMKFENSKLNIKAIEDNDSIDKVLNTIQTKLNFQRKNLKDRFNFESENEYNKDSEYLNYSTLLYMVKELYSINEYKNKKELELHLNKILNSYDTNKLSKINIMTVHKAKGLESDIVTIVNSSFQPKTFINKKTGKEVAPPLWMLEQMDNLKYVAYTRAKKQLNIIEVELSKEVANQ
jgi:superfamily I DNA/RNA helicase